MDKLKLKDEIAKRIVGMKGKWFHDTSRSGSGICYYLHMADIKAEAIYDLEKSCGKDSRSSFEFMALCDEVVVGFGSEFTEIYRDVFRVVDESKLEPITKEELVSILHDEEVRITQRIDHTISTISSIGD